MPHTHRTQDMVLFDHDESLLDKNPMTSWVLPWADLMMIMFVLFVALFIYANNRKDTAPIFASGTRAETAPREGVMGSIEDFLQIFAGRGLTPGANLRTYERTREIIYKSDPKGVSVIMEADGGVRVVLRGDIAFAKGHSDLSPESLNFLKEVAEVIRLSQNTVHIVGHAEESETKAGDDLRLSTQRAATVAEFFIRTGLAPRRFMATGLGASRPEAAPLSEQEQHKNRRVEIVILSDALPTP